MALTMRKMAASSVPGTEPTRTADVWAIFENGKAFKTSQGSQKWFTQEANAKAFIKKEEEARAKKESGKAAPKKSSGSRAKAKTSAPKSAPKSTSAKMTVASCKSFLQDQGYTVRKKSGAKKAKAEEVSDAEYFTQLNPRRRRLNRRRRKNPKPADRGGTYVMFWDDPNGPDPIVFTSLKGEDATYKAIQSDALYDYEDRAYGQIKPMRADAALLLLEQKMLRADSDGYDEGERYQYNRILDAVTAYKGGVTPARAKTKIKSALRGFVHPFEEGPIYNNPRSMRRLR